MLKWIKTKCQMNQDPVKTHPELTLRVVCDEVTELKKKVDTLEKAIIALAGVQQIEHSIVEYKPAPKKVGRPKKKH